MYSMFTGYSAIPDVPDIDDTAEDGRSQKKCWERKIAKRLKKQNKLIKELVGLQERRATNPVVLPAAVPTQGPSFLKKLGDAVLKAVPDVLKVVFTVATKLFFSLFFGKKNNRGGTWFGRLLEATV